MSNTWYGHHIETIKGEDYVLHKDYTELQNKLDKKIERLNNIISELENYLKKEKKEHKKYDEKHFSEWLGYCGVDIALDKLKELKESSNNE